MAGNVSVKDYAFAPEFLEKSGLSDYSEYLAKAQTEAQQKKVEKVMREFKNGSLKTKDGKKVTSRDQAIAIAMSEAGLNKSDYQRFRLGKIEQVHDNRVKHDESEVRKDVRLSFVDGKKKPVEVVKLHGEEAVMKILVQEYGNEATAKKVFDRELSKE